MIINNNKMNIVMLPQEAWEGINEDLKQMKSILQDKASDEVANQWIESKKARLMLGVSPKTWQKYRDSRAIPFAQFGRKIFVKKADLDAFMEEHYIKPVERGCV